MNKQEIRIIKLESQRVASVQGFGSGPEMAAWQKLVDWAKPKGYLDAPEKHRIFGFNNPNPTPGSPNYGYEYWMQVDADEEPQGETRVVDFSGGLYAVARCEVKGDAEAQIPQTWQKLVAWRENSAYKSASHQWLEEHIRVEQAGSEFTLDLYMPIAE